MANPQERPATKEQQSSIEDVPSRILRGLVSRRKRGAHHQTHRGSAEALGSQHHQREEAEKAAESTSLGVEGLDQQAIEDDKDLRFRQYLIEETVRSLERGGSSRPASVIDFASEAGLSRELMDEVEQYALAQFNAMKEEKCSQELLDKMMSSLRTAFRHGAGQDDGTLFNYARAQGMSDEMIEAIRDIALHPEDYEDHDLEAQQLKEER
jgi:hypothetical protein